MNVLFNPAGISFAPTAGYVDFAAWSWDLRTKLDVNYAGTTSATTPASGEILVRLATAGEWTAQGGTTTTPNAYAVDNSATAKTILLNPYIALDDRYDTLLTHEIGHALGYFTLFGGTHSTDADDIMHAILYSTTFPITTADANGVNNFTAWPSADTADLKSAMLMPNNDMMIPDILIGGARKQIQTDYIENSVATYGQHRWTIVSNVANEEGTAGGPSVTGSTATIPSLQSQGQDYINVTLTIIGSQIELTSYTLA